MRQVEGTGAKQSREMALLQRKSQDDSEGTSRRKERTLGQTVVVSECNWCAI